MSARPSFKLVAALLGVASIGVGACDGPKPPPEPAPGAASASAAPIAIASGPVVAASASAAVPLASGSAAPPVASVNAAVAAPSAPPDGMVLVPPGIYLQGGTNGRGGSEERPAHETVVPALYVDKTEVTAAAYAACVKSGACTAPYPENKFCNVEGSEAVRPDHPINCIDYGQAEAMCKSKGARLPTEGEWEYFAKAGGEQRHYAWGETEPSTKLACYFHSGTCAVGEFPPSAYGLLDVTGNVWEWTSSWFGDYPVELESGRLKVYRGGSWSRRFPKWMTTTIRSRFRVDEHSASLGVRCVKTKEPLTCSEEAAPRDGKCVRVKGATMCDIGLQWNGAACTVGGVASPAPAPVNSSGANVAAREGPAPEPKEKAPPAEETPVTRTRTPELDADCQRYYSKTPAAYLFKGGTFHKRNIPLEGGGCKRRDVSIGWTSACCPG